MVLNPDLATVEKWTGYPNRIFYLLTIKLNLIEQLTSADTSAILPFYNYSQQNIN